VDGIEARVRFSRFSWADERNREHDAVRNGSREIESRR
jgi:hypothetical protein